MSMKKYINAIRVYQSALEDAENTVMGEQFCGNIYNNMGCAYASLFQMEEAQECFRKSYESLHSRASMKSYLFAVHMNSGREAYEKLAGELEADAELRREMDAQMADAMKVELPGIWTALLAAGPESITEIPACDSGTCKHVRLARCPRA